MTAKNEAVKPEPEKVEEVESEVLPVENIETLKTKVSELETSRGDLETKLRDAEEGIKVHQRGSTKAREELQRVQDTRQLIEAQDAKIDTLSGMVAEFLDKSESLEEETPKRGKYTERVQAGKQEAALHAAKEVCKSFQERAEATGISMDDPRVERVKALVTSATSMEQIKIADGLMKELEAEKKPVEEPKGGKEVETEEQKIERIVQERLHEEKKKAGLLEGEPSGMVSGSGNWERVRADYIKNPSNPAIRGRYLEMRKQIDAQK